MLTLHTSLLAKADGVMPTASCWQVFSKAGDIKRIVMGLDKVRHTPCGFCFVVYYTRADTEDCVKYINGMALDERLIRVDFDWGFRDGRQFGRGKSGGQVRYACSVGANS